MSEYWMCGYCHRHFKTEEEVEKCIEKHEHKQRENTK